MTGCLEGRFTHRVSLHMRWLEAVRTAVGDRWWPRFSGRSGTYVARAGYQLGDGLSCFADRRTAGQPPSSVARVKRLALPPGWPFGSC